MNFIDCRAIGPLSKDRVALQILPAHRAARTRHRPDRPLPKIARSDKLAAIKTAIPWLRRRTSGRPELGRRPCPKHRSHSDDPRRQPAARRTAGQHADRSGTRQAGRQGQAERRDRRARCPCAGQAGRGGHRQRQRRRAGPHRFPDLCGAADERLWRRIQSPPGGGLDQVPALRQAFPRPPSAITLFGPGSSAALATVVGVLVEVPVMLSICRACNGTRGWYERAVSPPARAP